MAVIDNYRFVQRTAMEIAEAQGKNSHFHPDKIYWLPDNVHAVASNDGQTINIVQPCTDIYNLPGYGKVNPQDQSLLYSNFAPEIRRELFKAIVQANMSEEFFMAAANCECFPCNMRCEDARAVHRLTRSGRILIGSALPRQKANMSGIINLFQSCRRVYDEARPVLLQVNNIWFDGKAKGYPMLRALPKALTFHRGIKLPGPPVLTSVTFAFSLQPAGGRRHHSTFYGFWYAMNKAHWKVTNPIKFRRVNVVVQLQNNHAIYQFVPLLRALELLHGVQYCTVDFRFPDESQSHMPLATSKEKQVFAAMAPELVQAALAHPSTFKDTVRDAHDHFLAARKLFGNVPQGFFRPNPKMEETEARRWNGGLYDELFGEQMVYDADGEEDERDLTPSPFPPRF